MSSDSAPKSGDSYLASVSDLMIGMLFIFIIMLMAFALNLRAAQATTDVQAQALHVENARLTETDAIRRQMLLEIQKSLRDQGIPVEVDLENGILRLPEALLFDSGSAQFRLDGQIAVERLRQALSTILPCYSSGAEAPLACPSIRRGQLDSVFIEGHTDNVPVQTSEFKDNWDLSVARARVTYDALLVGSDILPNLRNLRGQPLFSMAAYGDTRPVAPNDSDENRKKNRRIDLRFIMAVPKAITTSDLANPTQGLNGH